MKKNVMFEVDLDKLADKVIDIIYYDNYNGNQLDKWPRLNMFCDDMLTIIDKDTLKRALRKAHRRIPQVYSHPQSISYVRQCMMVIINKY